MQRVQPNVVIVCADGPLAEKMLWEVAQPSRMPRKSPRSFEPHPRANCPFDGKLLVGKIGMNGTEREFILQCGGVLDGNVLLVDVNEPRSFCFRLARRGDSLFREGVEVIEVNSRTVTVEKVPECANSFAAHLVSGKGITIRMPRGPELPKSSRGHHGSFLGALWDVE